jgi:hypothetical protein
VFECEARLPGGVNELDPGLGEREGDESKNG